MPWTLDATLLARIQFAFTVSFHIIFPSFTIGLAAFIATLLVRWRITGEDKFHRLARYWTKIFAVSFAMGVVSGIVLSYEFGTNWSRFSIVVGNVLGPLLGYEVLTAFFLEASFLGIMLFGWNRVSPNLHVHRGRSSVAIGTSMSAFWILAANSWMHTPGRPRGARRHRLSRGLAGRSSSIRASLSLLAHVHGVRSSPPSSWCCVGRARATSWRDRFIEEAKTMLRMGLGHGGGAGAAAAFHRRRGTASTRPKHQPAKVAAMEAHWDGPSEAGAALVLFAIPNEKAEENDFEISIPNGRKPHHHAQHRRPLQRAQGFRAERPAAGDSRCSSPSASWWASACSMIATGLVGAFLLVPRPAVREPSGSFSRSTLCLACRLHRHPRRLVGDGDGPAALDRDRNPADGRCGIAGLRPCRADDAHPVRRHLYASCSPWASTTSTASSKKARTGAAAAPPHGVPSRPLSAAEEAAREAIDTDGVTPWKRSPVWLPLIWAGVLGVARGALCRCSTASTSASASCSRPIPTNTTAT